jgi:hypothetical protein
MTIYASIEVLKKKFDKILSLGDKKKSSVIHIEDFYEKDVPKLSHFNQVYFINHQISTIGSNWSQKYSRILSKILLSPLIVAKIG